MISLPRNLDTGPCSTTIAVTITILLQACGNSAAPPLDVPAQPGTFAAQTGFTDITAESGIMREFIVSDPANTGMGVQMGGGLAAADFDDDGDIDLYLVGGDGRPNALFRNDGDNQFVDVAAVLNLDLVNLSSGPAFADIDGDGDLDLFIGGVEDSRVKLFRQDPNGFVDTTPISGRGR